MRPSWPAMSWLALAVAGGVLAATTPDPARPAAFLMWCAPAALLFAWTGARMRWSTPRRMRWVVTVVRLAWGAGLLAAFVGVVFGRSPVPPSWLTTVWLVVPAAMAALVEFHHRTIEVPAAPAGPQGAVPTGCPPRPLAADPKHLGFTRRPMVRWFDPGQLAVTGIKALLSGIFGAYADRREIEAGVAEPGNHDYSSGGGDLWIDYVADLGDGWNSTFSVASLLARPGLRVAGMSEPLPRGSILILGGDQVYPTATRDEYQDRFAGPYAAALPYVAGAAPKLFAIPGNHDWYDGLTSFQRLFCQQRWIGGWRTEQTRSYFAIRLPHDWWLWGLDYQLDADIDHPQIKYFESVARQLGPEARIILCTSEPSWVYHRMHGEQAYRNLRFFQDNVVTKGQGRVVLNVSGDLHHYCRYREQGGPGHKITAGGGGAFLHATHPTPKALDLPSDAGERHFRRERTYPGIARSWLLKFSVFRLPFRNPWFAALLGAIYLLLAWFLQSASRKESVSLMEALQCAGRPFENIGEAFRAFHAAFAHSPGSVAFGLVVVGGLFAFAQMDTSVPRVWGIVKRCVAGLSHGAAHMALFMALTWLFSWWNLDSLGLGMDSPAQVGLFTTEMLVLGSVSGITVTSLYLLLANVCLKLHAEEVFSSQGIDDYKCFLRMRITKEGALEVHPLKVERVCRAWRLDGSAAPGDPWFQPIDRLSAELIEPVITIR